jgi:hypothetical protein
MSKKYFIPRQEAEKVTWLQNFANKLSGYATKYGITTAEVDDMVAAAIFYAFWANYLNQYSEYNKKLVQYRNELRDGITDGATASVLPDAPGLGTVPAAVPPGVFKRASSIAGVIKSRTVYTEADGLDLGIEGSEAAKTDLIAAKPAISIRLVQGGKPEIVWNKGDFDGIDIYVDRGAGAWTFLAYDTYPNYIDNAPLPAIGTAAVWKYRAIYKYDDERAGDWSDVVSITVAG